MQKINNDNIIKSLKPIFLALKISRKDSNKLCETLQDLS